jgi:hypothetical protein
MSSLLIGLAIVVALFIGLGAAGSNFLLFPLSIGSHGPKLVFQRAAQTGRGNAANSTPPRCPFGRGFCLV